jgi:hypothetical protein
LRSIDRRTKQQRRIPIAELHVFVLPFDEKVALGTVAIRHHCGTIVKFKRPRARSRAALA